MSTVVSPRTGQAGGSPSARRLRWLVGGCLAVGLLVTLPTVSGVPWATTWAVVRAVPADHLGALVLLWGAGLLTHTLTLTAALPRLTHRRALTLNLTGSAVANLLPMGGAAGIALNYRMTRGWGFTGTQFAAFTVITNAWDVTAKLLLPLAFVPAAALVGDATLRPFLGPWSVAAVLLALGAALPVAVLSRRSVADRLGLLVDRALATALRLARSTRTVHVRRHVVEVHDACSHLVRTQWLRLSTGMTLYTVMLLALLWCCLTVTHAGLVPAAVLGGFAGERLLTLAGLTPGGAGVVELGLTGVLVALGGTPTGVVAGVLLYRTITVALEVPVGGLGLAAWWWRGRSVPVPAGR